MACRGGDSATGFVIGVAAAVVEAAAAPNAFRSRSGKKIDNLRD